MATRNRIDSFDLSNPIYSGGTVSIFTVDVSGVKTTELITLYENSTGPMTAANPQQLGSDGRFEREVWVEVAVIASITGATVADHDTGIIRQFGDFKNDWATTVTYQIGDLVVDGSAGDGTENVYIAVETHISSTWAVDLAASKWNLYVDVESATDTVLANAAASSSILEFIFDALTSMADPGSGDVRFNNATVSSVTSMAFSNLSSGSGTPDVSDFLAALDDVTNAVGGSVITIRKVGAPGTFAAFYVTSITDNTSWLQASVTYFAGAGTFSESDSLQIVASINGQDGTGTLDNVEDDLTPTLGGDLDGDDKEVKKVNLRDYGEVTNSLGSIGGGTQDIDLELGNVVTGTVDTSTTTFTFSNPTASDEGCGFTLILTNGGSQTVNWPASVDWGSATAPTLTASGVDILVFLTVDGGTTWHGMVSSTDSS